MPREYVTQSVSFSPQQLAAAKARAESLGLGFSQYVQVLVSNDVLLRRPLRILTNESDAALDEAMLAKRTQEFTAPPPPPPASVPATKKGPAHTARRARSAPAVPAAG